jgi:hypothetical protein
MIERRQFIAGLAGATAWPLAALAQQAAMPVIGFLSPQSARDDYKDFIVPFLQGLKETGYVEGQNVAVEYRWAENKVDRLPTLATDLARRRIAVFVTVGVIAALAAKAATTTIPIVFNSGIDPVASGLVASLNRPGGNLTGITILSAELAGETTSHRAVPTVNANVASKGQIRGPSGRPHAMSILLSIRNGRLLSSDSVRTGMEPTIAEWEDRPPSRHVECDRHKWRHGRRTG